MSISPLQNLNMIAYSCPYSDTGLANPCREKKPMVIYYRILWPWAHRTEGLWVHNWNLVKFGAALIFVLVIQTGHKFSEVTNDSVQNVIWSADYFSCNLQNVGYVLINPRKLREMGTICHLICDRDSAKP